MSFKNKLEMLIRYFIVFWVLHFICRGKILLDLVNVHIVHTIFFLIDKCDFYRPNCDFLMLAVKKLF